MNYILPTDTQFVFKDRKEAGKLLSKKLIRYAHSPSLVLAIPRGGVAVGNEMAHYLDLSLDVIISRKIGSPNNPEFGIGAVSENGAVIIDRNNVQTLDIKKVELNRLIEKEKQEVIRRVKIFRQGKKLPDLQGKNAIIVDDGLATGVTAEAAVAAVRKLKSEKIIFAAPVCALESAATLQNHVDQLVCLYAPYNLRVIGAYYQSFTQVTDEEVLDLLKH